MIFLVLHGESSKRLVDIFSVVRQHEMVVHAHGEPSFRTCWSKHEKRCRWLCVVCRLNTILCAEIPCISTVSMYPYVFNSVEMSIKDDHRKQPCQPAELDTRIARPAST